MTEDKRQAIEFAQALRRWATPSTSDHEEATGYLQLNGVACGEINKGGVCVRLIGHDGKCKFIKARPA